MTRIILALAFAFLAAPLSAAAVKALQGKLGKWQKRVAIASLTKVNHGPTVAQSGADGAGDVRAAWLTRNG